MKKPYTLYHRDGSLWAKGEKDGEIMEGYWQWFRKDGSKMRSGYFKNGKQVGEWITYNKQSQPIKTTMFGQK